ncbi:MerC domain-containing protein [Thermomonas brevis]
MDVTPPKVIPAHKRHGLLDRIGATGAFVCALHCALVPLLVALLPALGISLLLAPGFEFGFVLFASLFGLAVLAWSYRRHRTMRALALLVPGLLVLWVGVLYPPLHESVVPHAVAMTFGGTLVALAHLANLRLNHGHVHDATCAH